MHDSKHHVPFRDNIGNVHMGRMRTTVNDTIHIEIQVVKLGQESIVRYNLVDLRITLGNPAIELTKGADDSISNHGSGEGNAKNNQR
jgi:phosphotransferase system IIB component